MTLSSRGKYKSSTNTDMKMKTLVMEEPIPQCAATGFNIEELKNDIRTKLLRPIRFLRTVKFEYMDLEKDHVEDAYFVNEIERNYAFLWAAFTSDRPEPLQKLHQQGANVNFTYPDLNINALHLSALCGSIECTKWLLEVGCQILETSDNLSPLHFAVLINSHDVCSHLIHNGCPIDSNALRMAVWASSIDCIKCLLQFPIFVNEYGGSGMNALHISADLGNTEVMRLLLSDKRIDLNAKTRTRRYTALHLAAENGHHECLTLLLDNGANIDELSVKKKTPLYLACRENFLDCVELLLKRGAAVNAQDCEGRTPLHAAVSKSLNFMQIHVVQSLIDREADVRLADDFGYTALHTAALNELDACVEHLILSGANVTAKTNGNVTALNIMRRKTPKSTDKIKERLDMGLAYNTDELLKFSFRDINGNSTIGEIGYLYTLQKEGQTNVLEHPLCEAFLHLKWQKVRPFILLRLGLSLITVVLLSSLIAWGMAEPKCYEQVLCEGCNVNDSITPPIDNSAQELCWNETSSETLASFTLDIEKCAPKVCKNITLSTSNHPPYFNTSLWTVALFCERSEQEDILEDIPCHPDGGILNKLFEAYKFVPVIVRDFIMAMLVLNTLRIIFTIPTYKSVSHFFLAPSNILEILVTLFVPLNLMSMCRIKKGEDTNNWEYFEKSFASISLFFSWAFMMISVSHLPAVGMYVAMFQQVLKEFLKMIAAFLCLLMGFSFTFCILRIDLFQNPVLGLIKIMAMMSGELGSDDLLKDQDKPNAIPFQLYTTAFVLTVFLIVITVVLMNLLVGIAVNDVEGLRKNANLSKLIEQTKLIRFIEKTCFDGFFPPYVKNILRRFLYVWPDSYTGVVIYVRPQSPAEKRLPRDIMEAGSEKARERSRRKKLKAEGKKISVEDRIISLTEQILKLKELVANVQQTIENVAKSNGSDSTDEMSEDNEMKGTVEK